MEIKYVTSTHFIVSYSLNLRQIPQSIAMMKATTVTIPVAKQQSLLIKGAATHAVTYRLTSQTWAMRVTDSCFYWVISSARRQNQKMVMQSVRLLLDKFVTVSGWSYKKVNFHRRCLKLAWGGTYSNNCKKLSYDHNLWKHELVSPGAQLRPWSAWHYYSPSSTNELYHTRFQTTILCIP